MKRLFALTLLVLSFRLIAQPPTYTVSRDPKKGGLIYNGLLTFNDLGNEKKFSWLKSGREDYIPDAGIEKYLRLHLGKYAIVVVLGTWCSDSQDMIPKFERVIRDVSYPLSSLTMYGVDRSKKTRDGEEKKYNITLVPTIILFRDGKEAGRITETVDKSIEEDLMNIIERDLNRAK